MSEVRNGKQKEQKYSEIFYGGQKLHKYFSSLSIRGTSLLTCLYIGDLRNGQKFKREKKLFIVFILILKRVSFRFFFFFFNSNLQPLG